MRSKGLRPNIVTYTTLVAAEALSGDVGAAEAALEKAAADGVTVDVQSLGVQVHAYAKAGNFEGAKRCLDRALAQGIAPNDVVYTTLMDACAQKGDADGTIAWFTLAREQGLRLTVRSYNAIITAYANKGAYGSDKAAKEWFKRATDDDMKPDVFTYTSLIAACAKVSNVDSAEAWLSKMVVLCCHQCLRKEQSQKERPTCLQPVVQDERRRDLSKHCCIQCGVGGSWQKQAGDDQGVRAGVQTHD
ncbi:unnamed protein product [Polarella glacialis]|uniref:PROP1-like PPR domain-containing protein n=1 Tax=Polarella glacialis TaxID=89957 RepID=A0A813G0Y3_POLGL|nr:unnamed protein product [Polarella glacialis]